MVLTRAQRKRPVEEECQIVKKVTPPAEPSIEFVASDDSDENDVYEDALEHAHAEDMSSQETTVLEEVDGRDSPPIKSPPHQQLMTKNDANGTKTPLSSPHQPPPPPPLQHDADITISEHDVAESLRPLPPAETDAVAEQREGCKLDEPLPPAPPIDRSNSVAGLGPRRRSLHPSGAGGPLLPTTANANEGIDAEAPSPSPKKQLSPARRRRSSCATAAAFESPSRVVDAAQPAPLAKGSSFVFSPDEGTPPEVDVRPAQPLSKGILTPNRALSRTPSGRVSWAPGTPTPLPSRERLHKRARGISDAALEEAGY